MFQRAILIGVAASGLIMAAVFVAGDVDVAHAGGPAFLTANLGKNCTVQFRRDLLGAASDRSVSPTVKTSPEGAEFGVSGKLSTVQDEWVVVEGENREYYIPQDTILLIEIHK